MRIDPGASLRARARGDPPRPGHSTPPPTPRARPPRGAARDPGRPADRPRTTPPGRFRRPRAAREGMEQDSPDAEARAIAQTCCPPAPRIRPARGRADRLPRATDTSAIACAMLALAISTKPAATSSALDARSPPRPGVHASRRAQRRPRSRLERKGKAIGRHPTEREVDVGQAELRARGWPARPAVTDRPRIGARALRAHGQADPSKRHSEPAARRDRVDAQHRRLHAHPVDLGLERCGRLAVAVSDTSVDVPPMSKPIARVEARRARDARAATTTPPAGPESRARRRESLARSVSPPEDCMKRTSPPGSARFERRRGAPAAAASDRHRRSAVSPRASSPISRATLVRAHDVRRNRASRASRRARSRPPDARGRASRRSRPTSTPLSRARPASRRAAASSRGLDRRPLAPDAPARTSSDMRVQRRRPSIRRSKRSGRSWVPISSTSPRPSLVTTSGRARRDARAAHWWRRWCRAPPCTAAAAAAGSTLGACEQDCGCPRRARSRSRAASRCATHRRARRR